MIRSFIAVNLAPMVIEEIAKVQSTLQTAKGDVRWTRAEGWHLTLKFLGDIAQSQVAPILEVLRASLSTQPPVRAIAQGLGAFPNLKRPRVVWAGLSGDGLNVLNGKIETALTALGFPREEQEFTPHLTLGRVRSLRGWEQVLAIMKAHEQTYFGESVVGHVTFYQSNLHPDGAVYRPLGSIALQRSVDE